MNIDKCATLVRLKLKPEPMIETPAMPISQRQEVLNVMLAQLLQERGVVVAPERILYTGPHIRQMPDVLVNFQGLRTAIEGEIESPKAKEKALDSATKRVESGLAHIGVSVVYPATLRSTDFLELKKDLERAELEIAVTSETGSTGFSKGNVDYLERILRSTFDHLVREDVVAEMVALLDIAVDKFAVAALPFKGVWGRLTSVLGGSIEEDALNRLTEQQKAANCRIAGLVLMNAMIFHGVLSQTLSDKITALRTIVAEDKTDVFMKEWQYILDNINYYPIFHLARSLYISLPPVSDVSTALLFMAETAQKICSKRAALRHDLMGRIYHRLLTEAKYLGTYYTSIPAATLLLKLTLEPRAWSVEWDKIDQISELKIADLSCGTGTLLMAAADTLVDNHISTSASKGKPIELALLHKQNTENVLYGYDILAAAVHLTASTLALRTPDIPFKKMNLFCLPYGGDEKRQGSIEFVKGRSIQLPLDGFSSIPKAQQVTGQGIEEKIAAPLPDLDLCVMNPPFVRSTNSNLLFGSLPDIERPEMQNDLKKLVKQFNLKASVTSGLGSVFVAIGDRYIKPGGRLALVLPKALLSGVSWNETRQLINQKYHIEYIVVSHDPERWNFSESTSLSEVLLVATRNENDNGKPRENHQATVVNLWRNPVNTIEALTLASQITHARPPDLATGQGAAHLAMNGQKAGEVITSPWSEMQKDWFLTSAFAQADLTRVVYHLQRGEVWLPGYGKKGQINLTSLKSLGDLGPDGRDIHDGFEVGDAFTAYPALWGHKTGEMQTIAQEANKYLSPLSQSQAGRPLRKLNDLWPKASRLLLGARIRLNTNRVRAVLTSQPVLSNVWWPLKLKEPFDTPLYEKALALWLNSTLNLCLLLAVRQETEGAFIQFKKPVLASLLVLDLRTLTTEQLNTLAGIYDSVSKKELNILPRMATDSVRAEIDTALGQVLNLPDLSILRLMLGREPVITMKRL